MESCECVTRPRPRMRTGGYIAGVLAGGERAKAGPKAPAAGLCLEHVEYESPNAGMGER